MSVKNTAKKISASLGMAGLATVAATAAQADGHVNGGKAIEKYVGLFAGYSQAKFGVDFFGSSVDTSSGSFGVAGVLAGIAIHQNVMFYGLEADIAGLFGEQHSGRPPFCSISWCNSDWRAHLRARIGQSFGSAELFVAAGLAIGEFHGDLFGENLVVGFTGGAGVDKKIGDRFKARAEVLFDTFHKDRLDGDSNYDGFWTDVTVRGALIFSFGGD